MIFKFSFLIRFETVTLHKLLEIKSNEEKN